MAMQPQSSFDALSRVLDRLGSGDRTVRRAEAAAGGDADGPLRSTVEVAVPLSEALGVEASDDSDRSSPDGGVDDLEIAVRLPVFPSNPDGGPAVDLPEDISMSTTTTDVRLEDDGVILTLTVTIDAAAVGTPTEPAAATDAQEQTGSPEDLEPTEDFTRGGTSAARGGSPGTENEADPTSLAAVRDESVPPYDDTGYLARLYDVCDTFEEMSRRIEMDVSAETVRRYMIDAGVHSPASYETGAAEDPDPAEAAEADGADDSTASRSHEAHSVEGPNAGGTDREPESDAVSTESLPDEQLVTDGIGLPERLTLHDVVDAVLDARTVHEVQRELGLEHDRTRQLLRQLNVLDLVLRRVASAPDREVTAEDVAARIRESAPDGS
ncbi:hypothetical protein [Halobellus rufus]|uniref:hypothetical protein n=1 Tax=Halobellus rufus TaxID=1448860 RepID=UPI0006794068|nr:hypothetical protein [Halobellus rufus]